MNTHRAPSSYWKDTNEMKTTKAVVGMAGEEAMMKDTYALKRITELLQKENREVQETMKDTVKQYEDYGDAMRIQMERMEILSYSLETVVNLSSRFMTRMKDEDDPYNPAEQDFVEIPPSAGPLAQAIYTGLARIYDEFEEIRYDMESIDMDLQERIVENMEDVCLSGVAQGKLYSRLNTILEDLADAVEPNGKKELNDPEELNFSAQTDDDLLEE